MTRIYVEQDLATGQLVELPEAAARHLVTVLRRKAGDAFTLFNGRGGEYAATLESVGKRQSLARVGAFDLVNRESPLALTLAQSVSKGERMEFALQKAVELGVCDIVPVLTARSVVRVDDQRWEKKLEHWRGVIASAAEQCGRTRLPTLHAVLRLDRWLAKLPATTLKLTLAPQASTTLRQLSHAGEPIALLVGPEGGLSDAEIALAARHGFHSVTLGPRILRTETAGVAALAAFQALWGDFAGTVAKE
jgi:16S rRNA (uracil1498-N3)-methyltransferase